MQNCNVAADLFTLSRAVSCWITLRQNGLASRWRLRCSFLPDEHQDILRWDIPIAPETGPAHFSAHVVPGQSGTLSWQFNRKVPRSQLLSMEVSYSCLAQVTEYFAQHLSFCLFHCSVQLYKHRHDGTLWHLVQYAWSGSVSHKSISQLAYDNGGLSADFTGYWWGTLIFQEAFHGKTWWVWVLSSYEHPDWC